MMRIYLTHCSAEKDPVLKHSGQPATPDQLYTQPGIQHFMTRCKEKGVCWAILSDLYGVFRADDNQPWYEKHPDTVTPIEEAAIIQDFDCKLSAYNEIWFYMRLESFHPFYERVLRKTSIADRICLFNDLELIATLPKNSTERNF